MAADDSADDICRRMAELRRELSCDVQQVGRDARVMTDWTFYVRRFPWAVAGIALAAGFMLVPRRKEVIKPDPKMIEEMVRKHQIRVETKERPKNDSSFMKSLMMMGVTAAARYGANYITERMKTAAVQQPHNQPAASGAGSTTQQAGVGHARQPH